MAIPQLSDNYAVGYYPPPRRAASQSYRMLENLVSAGSPIAQELLHRVSSDCHRGRPFDESVDDAVATALQYLWSQSEQLKRERKIVSAPAPAPAAKPPAEPIVSVTDELLRFVAALPLQDHPIKLQKEREAIVNRAMTTLRPGKKLL